MRVVILGAAAGGGVPQWNCSCAVCRAAVTNQVGFPRTQSSIAVRGDTGPWFLFNCSPDVREQLPALGLERTAGARSTPFAAVVLTDAEVDHTAGLLLLRESSAPLHVYCTDAVRSALSTEFPLLRMLDSYCGVVCSTLEPGSCASLPQSSLELMPFETGDHSPRYARGTNPAPGTIGLFVRDGRTRGTLAYAPCVSEVNDRLAGLFDRADCIMVDGTFWRDDELIALGATDRTARAMGHLPLAGADGTLAMLAGREARTILVHVNNTNPVLLHGSDERDSLTQKGIEIGYDGMEVVVS